MLIFWFCVCLKVFLSEILENVSASFLPEGVFHKLFCLKVLNIKGCNFSGTSIVSSTDG